MRFIGTTGEIHEVATINDVCDGQHKQTESLANHNKEAFEAFGGAGGRGCRFPRPPRSVNRHESRARVLPDLFYTTAVGNKLFYSAVDGVHGVQLWVTDGTAGNTIELDPFCS